MTRISKTLIGVEWLESRSTENDHYAYPDYLWRYGSARSPAVAPRGFRRSGDKRFGGWSC